MRGADGAVRQARRRRPAVASRGHIPTRLGVVQGRDRAVCALYVGLDGGDVRAAGGYGVSLAGILNGGRMLRARLL